MEAAKRYYYDLMGWDANGVPKAEKLEELGIEAFAPGRKLQSREKAT